MSIPYDYVAYIDESGDDGLRAVKLLPNFKNAALDPDQAEIFRYYGYPYQWWDPEAFS